MELEDFFRKYPEYKGRNNLVKFTSEKIIINEDLPENVKNDLNQLLKIDTSFLKKEVIKYPSYKVEKTKIINQKKRISNNEQVDGGLLMIYSYFWGTIIIFLGGLIFILIKKAIF